MTSPSERLSELRSFEQSLVRQLTGPSHGVNRPSLSKELASVRRRIAMLAEADRTPMGQQRLGR